MCNNPPTQNGDPMDPPVGAADAAGAASITGSPLVAWVPHLLQTVPRMDTEVVDTEGTLVDGEPLDSSLQDSNISDTGGSNAFSPPLPMHCCRASSNGTPGP